MWRQKRKAFIVAVIFMIVILFALFKALPKILPQATCNDGVRNQNELDIDCGGECQKVCKSEYLPITVDVAKAIQTGTTTYKLFGLLKNPNADFKPTEILYKFYIYDKDGNKKEIGNNIKVPVGQYIPIVVENYQADNIAKVNLTVSDYEMKRSNKDFSVILKDFIFENGDIPKLQIFYTSPYRTDILNQFVFYVLTKDKDGNILSVDTTDVKGLYADRVDNFYLSFKEKFDRDVSSLMLLPIIYE